MFLLNRRTLITSSGAALAAGFLGASAEAAAGKADVFTADANGALVDSTIVVGEKKVLVIDAQFTAANASRLAEAVAATGKELETIYITHFHPDHHLGLAVLMDRFPNAKPVAHKSVQPAIAGAAQAMLEQVNGMFPGAFASRVVIPETLAGDKLTLEDETFNIIGPFHSDTPVSTAVHLPGLDTLVASDALYRDTHVWLAENTKAEDIAAWRKSLDDLEAIGAKHIIPGHRLETSPNDATSFAHVREYISHWEQALASAKTAADLKAAMIEKVGARPGEFFLDRAVAAARP
jgi:glyoxylase-like metal-dependent hydrolase (beta-lactamase superfamily II)